ncbi:MAG: Mov34/MPN/PAD-1 family protein, partial [Clostridia bacterium]|nr:Mov34/MPN/PAD-1 family protein [Clostridia bacterium]
MIKLPKSFYDEIVEAAKSGRPEEICGLIGGTVSGDEKTAEEIYFLENIDHSNEHFSMNPKEQLEAVKDMR